MINSNTHKSKILLGKNIQLLFKCIKSDDLEKFKSIIEATPSLINFKNKQKENLLFYSAQRGSSKIMNFLIQHNEDLLYEKNIYSLTCFSNLVYTNNTRGLEVFHEVLKPYPLCLQQIYHLNGEEYNLPLLAVSKLNDKSWKVFTDCTSHLWLESNLLTTTNDGNNIAHIIARNNSKYCLNILDICPKEIFSQKNHDSSSTPFLVSAFSSNSSIEVLSYLLKYSDINETTSLGSNALHLASNNTSKNFKFLLDNNINPHTKNIYQYTPLMNTIVSKNDNNTLSLLPYYTTEDVLEETLELITNSPKNTYLIEKFLSQIHIEQLSSIMTDKNHALLILNYVFHYYNEKQFKDFKTSSLWNITDILSEDKIFFHQLFVTTIVGKKAMSLKIKELNSLCNFISAEESQLYFTPQYANNELLFKNSHNVFFNKIQKSFCFVAALGSLPVSQINEILLHSNILEKFSDGDFHLLHSIAIKKQSNVLLNYIPPIKSMLIQDNSNLDLAIQDNLSYFTSSTTKDIESSFYNLLNNYPHNPEQFIYIVTQELTDGIKDIKYLKSLFSHLNNSLLKKNITSNMINHMLKREDNIETFEIIFSQNDKAITYFLNTIHSDSLDDIKNNDFFDLLLKNYNHLYNPLNLAFDFTQSENIEKDLIFHKILNTINPLDIKLDKEDIRNSLIQCIKDSYWQDILQYLSENPNYTNIVELFIEHQSKFCSESNYQTIQLISPFIKSIDIDIVADNLSRNTIINDNGLKNLELFIDIINPAQENYIYQILGTKAVEQGNFSYLNYLSENYFIDLSNIKLDQYWNNPILQQEFVLDITQPHFKPLDDYLNFLEIHADKFDIQFWESNSQCFYNWLCNNNTNQLTKIKITTNFFSSIEENISLISDDIIINICAYILERQNKDLIISQLFDPNTDNVEQMLDLFFNNKENPFFIKMNENISINNNINSVPAKQQIQLKYHVLKHNLDVLNRQNGVIHKPDKKKNKI